MFKTIYTVTHIQCGGTVKRTFFEEYDDAKTFAEKQVREIEDKFVFNSHYYPDGSLQKSWVGDNNEVVLNDFAWITDYRVDGVCFYDEQGLTWLFSNYEDFKKCVLTWNTSKTV